MKAVVLHEVDERTVERELQRASAMRRANEVRRFRSVLKKDLKAGRVGLDFVLFEARPDLVASMQVFDVLVALPKFGERRADAVMRRMKMGSRMKLAGVSRTRREELAARVAGQL